MADCCCWPPAGRGGCYSSKVLGGSVEGLYTARCASTRRHATVCEVRCACVYTTQLCGRDCARARRRLRTSRWAFQAPPRWTTRRRPAGVIRDAQHKANTSRLWGTPLNDTPTGQPGDEAVKFAPLFFTAGRRRAVLARRYTNCEVRKMRRHCSQFRRI